MVDQTTPPSSIVVRQDYDAQLLNFENTLLDFLDEVGLPTQDVFSAIGERANVFKYLIDVLKKMDFQKRQQSLYLSKFVAAVGGGLFDAALNYLWDETISELRHKVAQYDLSYFFDNFISNAEKRNLRNENDLTRVDDSELIRGANKIGLITDIGYSRLEHIRSMRNWASAAHPNQIQLTGLDLVSWLETCIINVISLQLSQITIDIGKLLTKVKSTTVDEANAEAIASYFEEPPNIEQVNNFVSGLFGIYTRTDTTPQARQNIHLLLPLLWEMVDEETRFAIGLKYGDIYVSGDKNEEKLAHQFLEAASALAYIPDNIRWVEIKPVIENLLNAHRNFGNFYSEPGCARDLQRLIGELGNVPPRINRFYVHALVEVFLTNGHAEAWNAEPIYKYLISLFDSTQALIAILSFTDITIASRLEFQLCQQKYRELVSMMKVKVTDIAVKELINDIEAYNDSALARMKDDTRFKRKIDHLNKTRRQAAKQIS